MTGKYWDEGIVLISGCTPASVGCQACWSLAMEKRFPALSAGGEQHGAIRIHPDRIWRFKRRTPTVFSIWNDLFHPDIGIEFQRQAFLAMRRNRQHTYLVLTKRPENVSAGHNGLAYVGSADDNIFLGVTAENQPWWDTRVAQLCQNWPGKKFVSIEPMLGDIDCHFQQRLKDTCPHGQPPFCLRCDGRDLRLDGIILGGETGPGARPMDVAWVRRVRDDCKMVGVPFFFKGWGQWVHDSQMYNPPGMRGSGYLMRRKTCPTVFDWPDGTISYRLLMGKSWRFLDVREHNELAWK